MIEKDKLIEWVTQANPDHTEEQIKKLVEVLLNEGLLEEKVDSINGKVFYSTTDKGVEMLQSVLSEHITLGPPDKK